MWPSVEVFSTPSPKTWPSVGKRQGPGAGAQRGPSLRRVTRHKGDSREAAAGADFRSPATRNCGYRPAAPLLLRNQARLPAFLSPLSRRTGRPEPISGLRVFGIDQGRGRGSRWLLGGAAGLPAWYAGASLSSPLSPVPAQRLTLLRARARFPLDFAPRRALLQRAGQPLLPAAAGKRVAQGSQAPGPTWLKSASTSPSCRESRKVRAGRWSARGPLPSPSSRSLPAGASSLGPPRPSQGAHLVLACAGLCPGRESSWIWVLLWELGQVT